MIKLFRASGRPIENADYYLNMMNNKLDQLIEKYGRDSEAMRKIEPELADLHLELVKQYPLEVQIDYPKSLEELQILLEKFESVAFCIDDGKIVAYILDAQ